MNLAILTLCEGDYHLGVAALINSAVRSGFRGKFLVYFKGEKPAWACSESLQLLFDYQGVEVIFENCKPSRHFGHHKPFAALEILEKNPDLDGVVYADPDVCFLAPWPFFEKWIGQGVALCLDSDFPWVNPNHPWRQDWRSLVMRAGLPVHQEPAEYCNSGFFAVKRSDIEFLQLWVATTLQYEKEGGDTQKFNMDKRHLAVVSDQDLLAASLHSFQHKPAYLGQEGMGFNGHYFILSHAIENPKPWRKCFTKLALKGWKPSAAAKLWLKNTRAPIQAITRLKYYTAKIDLAAGLFISRFWRA